MGDLRVYYELSDETPADSYRSGDRNQREGSRTDRRRKNQAMTKVEFKKASGPLSEYAEKARKGPIIVVKRGKPFAAVVPIRNADEETLALSTNRKFLKIIERSRARVKKEGAISASELRRRLDLGK
jgi:prevent-host-death family protein